jgi:hypothetical protein
MQKYQNINYFWGDVIYYLYDVKDKLHDMKQAFYLENKGVDVNNYIQALKYAIQLKKTILKLDGF